MTDLRFAPATDPRFAPATEDRAPTSCAGSGSVLRNAYMAGLRGSSAPVFYTGVGIVAANTAASKSNLPGVENVKPYSENWEHTKEGAAYHTPLSANEYNWSEHRTAANRVFGPVGGALAGVGG